jgi:putative chitobiose transport system substrate-binding protein
VFSRIGKPAIAACLAIGLTAACVPGGSDDEPDEPAAQQTGPATVEFWTINLKKNYRDYFQGLINDFEAQNPEITIDWVDVPGPDIESKFLASLASEEVPDAVNLVDIYTDQFAEGLADVTPYFSEDELGIYIPGLVDSLRREDALLGIPWYHGGSPVAWYNTRLTEQAGIAPDELPTTWAEALEFGRTIAESTDACGFSEIPRVEVLRSEGLEVLSPDGTEATLNTPEAAKILNDWRDAYRDGAICPGAVSEDVDSLPETVDNQLAAGVVGGLFGLPFNLLNTEKNAPDVYRNLHVTNAATGAAGTYIIPGVNTFVIPEGSDVKAAAAEFIKFVTSPEAQLEFCKLVTIFPSTQQSLEDPFFTDIQGQDPQDVARGVVVEQSPDVITADLQTTKDTELLEAYLKEIRAFMTGDDSAEDVLADVEEEWNDILAQE